MLGHADNQGESTEFVEFMLGMIRDALQEISKAQNEHDAVINVAKNVVTNIMWRQFDVIFLWSWRRSGVIFFGEHLLAV